MSDSDYDKLIDQLKELNPDDELLSLVGIQIVDESRKTRLAIEMASMNKIKTMEDINGWYRLKSISKSTIVVITPKYDGLSLCVDETTNSAFTRGDGYFGQKSNEHYKLMSNKLKSSDKVQYTYGEVMISKKTFNDKYAKDFANPRNLVAGLLNSKEATNSLKDCDYIKYGAVTNRNDFQSKTQILDYLNNNQDINVPYHVCRISELTEDLLINLFNQYSADYEIDGLIIEVNNLGTQLTLGRETSTNNPVWARAFKHESFEQKAETEILRIDWIISKSGFLKPVARLKPVHLDGVTVSNVTCNNARFVKDMGLGAGSIVKIVRSGMVIPKIIEVIKSVDFQMPDVENIIWNENGIELMTATETDEQRLKKNIAFFEILEADNVSEGVITQLWEAGYKTIKDILILTKEDLEKIDRFGKRKAKIVYDSIQNSIKDVQLSKLQHATGMFKGLGSLRLAKLEHFKTKPTIDDVMNIEGFAEKSAKSYVDNYNNFFEFIENLPIIIKESVEVGDTLNGKIFVFTGVRLPDVEKIILSNGGKIGTSVSKNSSYLVMKSKNSGSSKEKKALELGIQILEVEELNNLLKNLVE
jgi:NAD-dependent DNA ligase